VTLEEKIVEIIVDQLEVTAEECVPGASFIDDLGADSLDLAELLLEMEDTFDVEIPTEELKKIRKIQDVIDYLKARNVTWC